MKKVSEMLIAISGELLQTPDNLTEMNAHLDIVVHAWNLSLLPREESNNELQKFLTQQKPYAPTPEDLDGLKWEYKRIMKQKHKLFPEVQNRIRHAMARETSKDNYIIRAYFE